LAMRIFSRMIESAVGQDAHSLAQASPVVS
jgi:hypothetical protein